MSTDAKKDSGLFTDAKMSGRIVSVGPGKNVLMPDIYAVKETELETVAESSGDIDESQDINTSTGFNPYDTAVLQKKSGSKPR